jgi:hypothetical protein
MRFDIAISAFLLLVSAPLAPGADLRFSGVLGQSQPPGAEPLTAAAMRGAVIDRQGQLWSFAEGRRLRRFARQADGGWIVKESFEGPSGLAYHAPIQLFGDRLVYRGGNGWMLAFDLNERVFSTLAELPGDCASAQAFVDGDGLGFVALVDNGVWRLSHGDEQWQKLFDVPAPETGRLYSIGVLPSNGDILVGSSYPDMRVRCFARDGNERVNSLFPRMQCHSHVIVNADGQTWALGHSAVSLSSRQPAIGPKTPLSDCTGLARAGDGSLWLASNEGLVGSDANRRPLRIRVGGLGNYLLPAVAPDGTLALYDGIMRLLMIDDSATTPLAGKASAELRVGQRWDTRAAALCYDPADAQFLVLDNAQNRLWSFRPNVPWSRNFWQPLTDESTFNQPIALARGGGRTFVIDSGRVLANRRIGNKAAENAFTDLGIDADGPIAANREGDLFLVHSDAVSSYAFNGQGKPELQWTSPAGLNDIRGIAAGQRYIAVAETNRISILSTVNGALECALSADAIEGGFSAAGITILEPWVLFGDLTGHRILRLRIITD